MKRIKHVCKPHWVQSKKNIIVICNCNLTLTHIHNITYIYISSLRHLGNNVWRVKKKYIRIYFAQSIIYITSPV
jgi:hypothetical protein